MSISAAPGSQEPADARNGHGPVTGWVQAHGFVLVVRQAPWRIVQASTSVATCLRRGLDTLLLATLHDLGGNLETQVQAAFAAGAMAGAAGGGDNAPSDLLQALAADTGPVRALRCSLPVDGQARHFVGRAYPVLGDALVIELEPEAEAASAWRVRGSQSLMQRLATLVQAISEAGTLEQLRHCAAAAAQELTAMSAQLLPTHDLPGPLALSPGGRVHLQSDTQQEPSEMVPLLLHDPAAVVHGTLDLSRGHLGSLPRQAVQALRERGMRGLALVPVQSDGQPWGGLLLESPQAVHLPERLRAALELLAEAVGTRLAAIEHHARARVAQQLRGLEQRLLDATSMEGDWRHALVREASILLLPLRASGAVLMHGGEIFSCGRVPPLPELRLLLKWAAQRSVDPLSVCNCLEDENATLAALAPAAARVISARLSTNGHDRLLWLRAPLQPDGSASPPWSATDCGAAASVCRAVAEVSVQVHAVRLLIAENQLAQLRAAVAGSQQPVVVASAGLQICQTNPAFDALTGRQGPASLTLEALLSLFANAERAHRAIGQVRAEQRPWRGELALKLRGGASLPVAVRAEPVPARDGSLLGFILLVQDLRAARLADAARKRLEATLSQTRRELHDSGHAELLGAMLANAGIAAMDIDDDELAEATAPLLAEVEASAGRAAALFKRLQQED